MVEGVLRMPADVDETVAKLYLRSMYNQVMQNGSHLMPVVSATGKCNERDASRGTLTSTVFH